jgi:hypothetical protein
MPGNGTSSKYATRQAIPFFMKTACLVMKQKNIKALL